MEVDNFTVYQEKSGRFVKWRTKVGARVNHSSVLAVLEIDGFKVTLKSPWFGTVTSVADLEAGDTVNEGTALVVLKPCEHPVVMKDMCGYCGQDLRMNNGAPGQRGAATSANTAMIHNLPELLLSESEAKAQGAADEEHLLKSRKLALLVDLDQTLIHTTNEQVDPKLKGVEHFQLYGPRSFWYHTKIRPHAKEFLKNLADIFELHICTFGVRMYAHTVARMLDESRELFRHRILSRDECFDPNLKTANLKALFPCGDRLACIIDDREDVWSFARNVIRVKPYKFFKHTGDINAPPGFGKTDERTELSSDSNLAKESEELQSEREKEKPLEMGELSKECENVSGTTDWVQKSELGECHENQEKAFAKVQEDDPGACLEYEEDKDDDYLYSLEGVLRRVHTAFYQCYDKLFEMDSGEIPDVKTIIPYVKQKVLADRRIVFSGLIPTNQPMESSNIYKLAVSFGAVVQEQIVTKESAAKSENSDAHTTHLVAAKWGTSKVHAAARLGYVKIVNSDWIWWCFERWEAADEGLFPLLPDSEGSKLLDYGPITPLPPSDKQEESADTSAGRGDLDGKLEDENMISFTREQLRRMSDEVEDALSDEDEDEPPEKIVKITKDDEDSSSSEDSLSGRIPKGWKRKSKDLQLNQDLEETDGHSIKRAHNELDAEEAESDYNSLQDDDDEGESVGSVDDEMAAALEREISQD